MKPIAVLRAALLLCCTLLPALGLAAWPDKPIRLLVPFAAGGPTDQVARVLAQSLSANLGQPVLVENKPGADGGLAVQAALSAPADGYTLLVGTSGVIGLAAVHKEAAFDPLRDFAPIGAVGRFAYGVFIHPSVPSRNLAEFIRHAKAQPGKLNFGASNLSEYFVAVQFMEAAGIRLEHIPYKGQAQMLPDLLSGRVQLSVGPVGNVQGHLREGKLRLIAVAPRTLAAYPGVPDLAAAGVKDMVIPSTQMLLAPVRTPADRLQTLRQALAVSLRDPALRRKLDAQLLEVDEGNHESLRQTIEALMRDWKRLAGEYKVAP